MTAAPALGAEPPEGPPLDSVQMPESKPWIVFPGWKVLLLQTLALSSLFSAPQVAVAAEALKDLDKEKITQTVDPARVPAEGVTVVKAEATPPDTSAVKETLDTARELWDGIADRHSLFSHERQLGDYTLKVDAGTTELDLIHKVRANVNDRSASVDLGLKVDVHALRAELSDAEPQGDWTFRHGLRADLHGHYTAAHRVVGQVQGTSGEDVSTHGASATVEGFAGWTREVSGGGKLAIDSSMGASQNLEAGTLTPYLQSQQVLRYDLSGRIPLMGDDVDAVVKLREGISYDTRTEELNPSYEAFAGVGKRLELKGHTIKLEVGARAKGDRHDAFDVGPKVKFGFRW